MNGTSLLVGILLQEIRRKKEKKKAFVVYI